MAGHRVMTPWQRQLARSALGLVQGRTRSYRNRFHCLPTSAEADQWRSMKRRGLAEGRSAKALKATFDNYWLTPAGARLALNPGETLDPEDFPEESAHGDR